MYVCSEYFGLVRRTMEAFTECHDVANTEFSGVSDARYRRRLTSTVTVQVVRQEPDIMVLQVHMQTQFPTSLM